MNCQIIEVLPLRKRSGEMCEDLDRCNIYEVHPLNGLLRVSYFFSCDRVTAKRDCINVVQNFLKK